MHSKTVVSLNARLDELVSRGTLHLKTAAQRDAHQQAAQTAIRWLYLMPLLLLLSLLFSVVFNVTIWWSAPLLLSVCLLWPVTVYLLYYAIAYRKTGYSRSNALALYDQSLHSADRLQAADEFIRNNDHSAFAMAAIADAQQTAAQALQSNLPQLNLKPAIIFPRGKTLYPILAAVFLSAITLITAYLTAVSTVETPLTEVTPQSSQPVFETAKDQPAETYQAEKVSPPTLPQSITEASTASDSASQTSHNTEKNQPGASSPAANQQSAASQQQSNSNNAQAQNSTASAQPLANKPQSAASAPPKASASATQKPEQESSTANVASGLGNSSGINTSDSEQPAQNTPAEQDNTEHSEQPAANEEDEQQKASVSNSQSRNQRKAAVDRKLAPSGGLGQPNDQANGRGGSGEQKKSRGVAAMLLGVPMPDRLQGTANSGRSKSMQERSSPQLSQSESVATAPRGQATGSIGTLRHTAEPLWLQQVIHNYFMTDKTGVASERRELTTQEVSDNGTE